MDLQRKESCVDVKSKSIIRKRMLHTNSLTLDTKVEKDFLLKVFSYGTLKSILKHAKPI